MKIARIHTASGPRSALVDNDMAYDLAALAAEANLGWAAAAFADLRIPLLAGAPMRELAADLVASSRGRHATPLADVRLLAPFEEGSRLLCHVVNYLKHAEEAKLEPPERPFFFVKIATSPVHPGEPISTHPSSRKLDFESELGVVIGRRARNVKAADAYAHVAGYTVVNDVSYRDLQFNEGAEGLSARYGKNWTHGKGLDGAAAIGPWIVTADEIPEPYPLWITADVNGEQRVRATTSDQIFQVPRLIEALSTDLTLYPGDVIATGAPAGGGIGTGRFLEPGDVVECQVERVGTLRNPVC